MDVYNGYPPEFPSQATNQPQYTPSSYYTTSRVSEVLDSFGVHWRIGKAIHKVKIRLDEPRDREALGVGTNSAVGSFLYQRPATERLASGVATRSTTVPEL